MTKYNNEYIISSVRSHRRDDEKGCGFYSNKVYNVGDAVVLDGLTWHIDEIVKLGKEGD